MNRLIIIGNGFDLAHGLKTKYEDFLLWYFKTKVEGLDYKTPCKDQLCTIQVRKEYKDGFRVSTFPDFTNLIDYKGYLKAIKNSSFYIEYHSTFFEKIMGETRWIDIENSYYTALKISVRNGSKTIVNDAVKKYIDSLNTDLDFLRDKFIEYLKSECNDFDFDVQETPYLKIFTEDLSFKNNNPKFLKEKFKQFPKTLLLNFNYTNLLKKYQETIQMTGDLIELIQIHGSVDNPENIVFGFGDELDETYHEIERLNENKFFEHIKSFKYFQDGNYQKLMAFVDNSPFEVIVLGHSLGLSDRTMLSQIFENANLKKVQLYYHEDQKDFTDKTFEISRHFSSKGRMRELIVPFTESKAMPQVEMNSKD